MENLFQGAYYLPRRCYSHQVEIQYPRLSNILNDIKNNLNICNQFENLNHLPIIIDECDPAVGTIYGIYDNPNFVICNTEYYPSFLAAMVYHILLLSSRIQLITHWAFYMEGKRLFEGNRTLVTNYNLHLPILNALKLFSKFQTKQLSIGITETQFEINALSTYDERNSSIQLLLFYHIDDWTSKDIQTINIIFRNLLFKSVLVKHYRIDSNNNNIYQLWIEMGQPDQLDENQLNYFKQNQQLKFFYPPIEYEIKNNELILDSFPFPAHSISFIEIMNNQHSNPI